MRIIVSNTGPLLHLSEAQSLDLLKQAGQISIPPFVAIEARLYLPAWQANQPSWIATIELLEPNLNEAQIWQQSGLLDRGEAEALALARQLNGNWFLTDDTAARVLAESLGVETHGSLGIVLWAAAAKHLRRDEAEQRVDALAASSLWISAGVIAEAKAALARLFAGD